MLVVGLGNPGPRYAGTRHNLGMLCVRELGRRLGAEITRKRWSSLVGTAPLPASPAPGDSGRNGPPPAALWLVLPQTMMNRSGRAVRAAVRELDLSADRTWVVHDELDLPLCRLRIRRGGSAGGHNGVESVIDSLGTRDFVRFRVGVGRPPSPAIDPVDYLLSAFGKAELQRLEAVVPGVASALEEAIASGLERAMQVYNRPGSLGCEELP